jgi:hypothetical protein
MISPLVRRATHVYMRNFNLYKKDVIRTNAIEIYFLIIKPCELLHYFEI